MPVFKVEEVPVTPFPWRESRVLVSPKRFDSQNMFVSVNELFPGAAHEFHSHPVDELFIVLDGEGLYEEGGVQHRIGPMSVVYAPRGTLHRTQCLGESRLRIIVVEAPPEPRGGD
jgi:mannose-6-phosphate isomerase-like protein (cupin superfamily)